MTSPYLLCSDLDRTILPNGPQDESPQARGLLARLAGHPQIRLAYVSGRDKNLLLKAIEEFKLPLPDFAIGNVGSTIYEVTKGEWHPWELWHQEIGSDWQGKSWQELSGLFEDLDHLKLQEEQKQNKFKLSYYTPEFFDRQLLFSKMQNRLHREKIKANLIWSIDEIARVGLLDVLPRNADKLSAILFLMRNQGFPQERTVFAGDSGNDLAVLTSGLKSILVKNARGEVRDEALRHLAATDQLNSLYMAQGNFLEMNGNYSGGVLEGLVHFFPETAAWLKD